MTDTDEIKKNAKFQNKGNSSSDSIKISGNYGSDLGSIDKEDRCNGL